MHESVLRGFFAGQNTAEDLRADLAGAIVQTSADVFTHNVVGMDSAFEVAPEHLVRVCDSVLAGQIDAAELEAIGYCLVTSEQFHWDGDSLLGSRVAETAHDWAAPEINYRLTPDTVRKFRERLVTGRNLFTRDDLPSNKRRR